MINLVFRGGGTILVVSIKPDGELWFGQQMGGFVKYAPIEGLKLNWAGIIKEFPDLEDKPAEEAQKIAIQRFKKKLKEQKTEKQKIAFVRKEMAECGYTLEVIQKKGFRPRRVK
ncbi:MAG: hypothetical protein JSW08_01995 [archaeon]|nr:MAG: hypothetical protein JSW08_01995 [archaeon]